MIALDKRTILYPIRDLVDLLAMVLKKATQEGMKSKPYRMCKDETSKTDVISKKRGAHKRPTPAEKVNTKQKCK